RRAGLVRVGDARVDAVAQPEERAVRALAPPLRGRAAQREEDARADHASSAMASTSMSRSGRTSALIATVVHAGYGARKSSCRAGGIAAASPMFVRYVFTFTTSSIVPPAASTSDLMPWKQRRACASGSPFPTISPFASQATWPEMYSVFPRRVHCE